MANLEDLTGRKFGKWTVLSRLPNVGQNTTWKCRCRCGNEGAIQAGSLKSGDSTQCRRCKIAAARKS